MTEYALYAAQPAQSRGRQHPEAPSRYRNDFQRDRDRIIHSAAFRRLEYKTQVFVNHEGDMFRTRLTHTLEVAQVSRTVARSLKLNEDLTEAIALAHDLGHTPFGHAGQDSLNACMQPFGGFEHNLQSLRIVDELEARYPDFRGLNLTFETREGILKHCSREQAALLGPVAERFLHGKPGPPGLEAQIANLCDALAYNSHDVDDALRAQLFSVEQICEQSLFNQHYRAVLKDWPTLAPRRVIHETIRRLIGEQVADMIETSRQCLQAACPDSIDAVRHAKGELIAFSPAMYEQHLALKKFLREHMYRHFRVNRMTHKAGQVISRLFNEFNAFPELLPEQVHSEIARLQSLLGKKSGQARAIADYIAGMTDRYAIAEYERLFNPGALS